MAIWNRLISVLDKTVLQWVFPPICIHCEEPTEKNRYFCNDCLEVIDNCFLYREDTQLCEYLGGKALCIAFENMGPLYTLAHESHPKYKKIFIEFVKLVYLQSNVFGCDGIICPDKNINNKSTAYIGKKIGLGLSLPVYKVSRLPKKVGCTFLLLYWEIPSIKEIKNLKKQLWESSINNINILILFNQIN